MTDIKLLKVATIIPGEKSDGSSSHPTRGTKVILSDGSELTGVTGITLRADVGDVWRAFIEVYPETVQVVMADAETCVVETTPLSDECRRYALATHTQGCSAVPTEGTQPLESGELVIRHGV